MESLYKGFKIYRHNTEKTVSVWLNGSCMESGFVSTHKTRAWVDSYLMRGACEHYGPNHSCEEYLDCCDCGGSECGCCYCWTCNACHTCLNTE